MKVRRMFNANMKDYEKGVYMDGYIIGNIIGRLLMSYIIVWMVIFLFFSGLEWKLAFKKTVKLPALLAVTILFLLGIAGAITQGGGL